MEVISYKKGHSNIYEVCFDNGKKYKIYDDIILKYEMLIDKKITQKRLEDILRDNTLLDSYYKALKYIGIKMRTEKEIEAYLKRYDFLESDIRYAIKRLKEDGYLDSKKYAEAYVTDAVNLSLDGPKKIEVTLAKLGVSSTITKQFLEKIPDEIWTSRIDKIIAKKAKINNKSESVFKNKMYSYLITLGYASDDIKNALDDFHLDISVAFLKEADKTWNALLRKSNDNKEVALKFKNKMYTKGFGLDDINDYLSKKDSAY